MAELLHIHLGLFKTVDFGKYVAQGVLVGGSEVGASSGRRYLLQSVLINYYRKLLILHLAVKICSYGIEGVAVGAYTYGVHSDAQLLGY